MRFSFIFTVVMASVLALACSSPSGIVCAQVVNSDGREFVESRSPLAGGGVVVSRSSPGQPVQTRAMVAQLPGRAVYPTSQQVLNPPMPTAYPYPLQTAPRQAAIANRQVVAPAPNVVAPNYQNYTPFARSYGSTFRQSVFQRPYPNNRTAQNTVVYPTSFQTPTALPPTTPATQLPASSVQASSSQVVQLPTGYMFNAPTSTRPVPTTVVVANQPVVHLQNMPPGTYLGRGIVGQPKAYIDGQPVRNLFRYIFP